ncbi:hypothetical protein XBP1_740019 [Xenorhabdus bovienii str. puntauvense]|uniref:Uncharacterized protein n=4 Tax=Xenorhabdus bovienii TaxID=40576 RepID=A0A077Q5W0_XENBV|nr:hypothetical protein XBFFR1_2130043 [Xenorhabdus bovienii str. feltiae France]CDG93500.1 hypothetical protein XBFFL1_2550020 [Xenorhabdus bovienii str. feltiae Florida]CDG99144.1 hypothetical protein XBP1_740019 [Xenorhabdus bovienii str. puntauvense]CDH03926.1 hypothetical protein XBFM1_90022 [Xenorhabdus bovienii str. feltiae Moldova]CDH31477.1 hypothetical protein XBI1_1560019 [Xenorhabdus bovienii str. Intermedium]CDM91886.1 conserved protein of unknown function [Xenorhabdus bovienii]
MKHCISGFFNLYKELTLSVLHTKQSVVSDKSVISGSSEVSDGISHLAKYLRAYIRESFGI